MDEKREIEPRSDLDELVERVEHGQSIELTRAGKGVAKIVPMEQPRKTSFPTWEELAEIRRGVELPNGMTIKDLINDGRRL